MEVLNLKLQDILILVEDRRFYWHLGIDPIAICRSLLVNLKSGRYAEGASTLTQQLARRIYLTNRKTLIRKLKEVFIAFYLEAKYNKKQILDLYMSSAYMGEGIVGFESASLHFFNKQLNEINLMEKIALVGMLKGPNTYGPRSEKGVKRQKLILSMIMAKAQS